MIARTRTNLDPGSPHTEGIHPIGGAKAPEEGGSTANPPQQPNPHRFGEPSPITCDTLQLTRPRRVRRSGGRMDARTRLDLQTGSGWGFAPACNTGATL